MNQIGNLELSFNRYIKRFDWLCSGGNRIAFEELFKIVAFHIVNWIVAKSHLYIDKIFYALLTQST